jgi:hypothetical protein
LWELLAHIEDTLAAKANRTHREKTPTDWADYSIVPLEFNRWQNKEGPYDVDGCCDTEGQNKQPVEGGEYWSAANDCTKTDLTGKNVWFNPPFEAALVRDILRQLHRCRRKDSATNATIVLPDYLVALVRDQLDLMPYLRERHRYPAGSRLFHNSDGRRHSVHTMGSGRLLHRPRGQPSVSRPDHPRPLLPNLPPKHRFS